MWSDGGPIDPSPTIDLAINGGFFFWNGNRQSGVRLGTFKMSKSRRRKRPKGPKEPHVPKEPPKKHPSKSWGFTIAFIGFVVTAVGVVFAAVNNLSGAATFVPRPQIDVSEVAEPSSPFPSSITITNGFVPLENVSILVRLCKVTNGAGGQIVGRKSCDGPSSGAGGITTPAWQNHRLATDEKWVVPMGANVPFYVGPTTADISIVVKYWPWMLPRLWFDLMEKEVRLVIHKQPDGRLIWTPRPID